MATEQLRDLGLSHTEQAVLNLTNKWFMRSLLATGAAAAGVSSYENVPAIHETVDSLFLKHLTGDSLSPLDTLISNPQLPPTEILIPPTHTPEPTPTLIIPTPTATPKPSPTETTIPPTPTQDIEASARKRLAERIAQIQASANAAIPTPEPPSPTEKPTPFPTQTPEPTPTPEIKKPYVVRSILFVPKDLTEQPDDLENINKGLKEVQKFFAEQLNGKTFKYNSVIVRGLHDLKYYCPNTIAEKQCIKEVGKVGPDETAIDRVFGDIRQQDPTFFEKGSITAVFFKGGYNYSGGQKWSQDTGNAVWGDWWFPKGTDTGCEDSPFAIVYCKDGSRLIAWGHELGHALGEGHTVPDNTKKGEPQYWNRSIMAGCEWEWKNCLFLDSPANSEKKVLTESPFIK